MVPLIDSNLFLSSICSNVRKAQQWSPPNKAAQSEEGIQRQAVEMETDTEIHTSIRWSSGNPVGERKEGSKEAEGSKKPHDNLQNQLT